MAVQEFVATKFRDLSPAEFQKDIASLKWRAIATTNFDRVIEKAYRDNKERLQSLVPILSDQDRVDDKLRRSRQLAYLKLHGCVSVTQREDLPLILTFDQYAAYRQNRNYVFQRLEGLAREYPIVFVGHQIQDVNLRAVLGSVSDPKESRPRYFLVAPDLSDIDVRFWETKRITSLQGTLEDLVKALCTKIPKLSRELSRFVEVDHPVTRRFRIRKEVPPTISTMLEHDVEYVHRGMSTDAGTPDDFYRGFGLGWYPIKDGLDVRRRLTDTILHDVIIRPEDERPAPADLYVVKAPAGAGKSVFLRRLAWEAAMEAEAVSLYVRPDARLSHEGLEELQRATGERIFIHWDNAAMNLGRVVSLMRFARRTGLRATVIVAERINEWNVSCGNLSRFVSDEFELRRLSQSEIDVLVSLLDRYECLGPNLNNKSHDERVEEFVRVADRHLLVALHEATRGAPLADILQDEFERIQPDRARQLYLTVCVLNRLRTPVRAGLISRVHDIPFEEFRSELFSPLDRVVRAYQYRVNGDYVYSARHPEIAQIVFNRVLWDVDDRLNEYLRIVGKLNLSYNTDRDSFRGLLRARALHELFPDRRHAEAIWERAEVVGSSEAYFFQQRANYERIRPDGNLDQAERFIERARELDPRDYSIVHTLAGICRARGESAKTAVARQRERRRARSLLRGLRDREGRDAYALTTLVRLELDNLRDLLQDRDSSDREIDEAIRAADRLVTEALQRHPDDQHLLNCEADFSALVADDARSLRALERASEANARDPFIANRLARALLRQGDVEGARGTLWGALEGNRSDLRLNFQYGEILRLAGEADADTLSYYFERSFSPGDRNFEGQFWFARYAFESKERRLREKSGETFRYLRSADLPHDVRMNVRDRLREDGHEGVFQGVIERLEETYGSVRRDGAGDLMFIHRREVGEDVWSLLSLGERVCFAIGFAFSGPIAVSLDLLSEE